MKWQVPLCSCSAALDACRTSFRLSQLPGTPRSAGTLLASRKPPRSRSVGVFEASRPRSFPVLLAPASAVSQFSVPGHQHLLRPAANWLRARVRRNGTMPEQRGLFEPRSWPLFPHFQRASLYMPCISILAADAASCGERSGYPTYAASCGERSGYRIPDFPLRSSRHRDM